MSTNKAIFLDRDGVINHLVYKDGVGRAPYSLEDFKLFDGVEKACALLKKADFLLIIVTNQPDVSRGWVSRESVDLINNKIRELLVIDDIKICFHDNSAKCLCRKPLPGMIHEAGREWGIDFKKSFMIGDRFGDISAGLSAGCFTILIGEGDQKGEVVIPDFRATSLLEASEFILNSL